MEKLLNLEEASRELGIAAVTLRRWVHNGRIKYRRIGPKLIRFTESDLREYLENATVRAGVTE